MSYFKIMSVKEQKEVKEPKEETALFIFALPYF